VWDAVWWNCSPVYELVLQSGQVVGEYEVAKRWSKQVSSYADDNRQRNGKEKILLTVRALVRILTRRSTG
jgi:ABC-type Fe3+-hydroxamate transport system substrate-binding protein